MNRLTAAVALMITIASLLACSSSPNEGDGASATEDELRGRNKDKNKGSSIACRSPRLTQESCTANGAYWGNDGSVYVGRGVCMQDDEDGAWVQCDGEGEGGDWNGGPNGDWYGFDTEGQPMRGACTSWIALGACGGGGGGSSSGGSSSTGPNPAPGKCASSAHGAVDAFQCFQEADWKWYQCQKDGVVLGAYGPNSGPLGPCQGEILWMK